MSPEDLQRVMMPFGQIRTAGDAQQGTGLGLPLAKAMIETGHGGCLELASGGLGQGVTATATVHLEWQLTAPDPLAWVQIDPAADIDVLCVDDSRIARRMIVKACTERGLTYEQARDGTEAVAAMARRRFSLVTMDRQMPVMKGDAATEAARAAGYTGTIVMVSGDTVSPAQEAALRGMGVTAFLGKMGTLSIHDAVARLGELKRDEAAGGGVGGVPGPVSVGAVVGAPAAAVAVVAV